MNKFLILLALIAAVYFIYSNYYNQKPYEIKENIVVTQSSGMDINSGPSPPPKYAHIEGTIKNVSDKNLINIIITYTVGYDTINAVVNFLPANQSSSFKTTSCGVRNANPQYSFEDVKFDDVETIEE